MKKIQVSVGSVAQALDRFEHAWRQAEKGGVRLCHLTHIDRCRHGHRYDHGLDTRVGAAVPGLVVEAHAVDPARERALRL